MKYKIDNLYTSIGFGVYLENMRPKDFSYLAYGSYESFRELMSIQIDASKYLLRCKYDTFLMQELKEEMFFDDDKSPFDLSFWVKYGSGIYVANDDTLIKFRMDKITIKVLQYDILDVEIKTLNDLALLTDGKIKLNEIEL